MVYWPVSIGAIAVVGLLCAKGRRVYDKLMVVLVVSLAVILLACVVACFCLRAGTQAVLDPVVIPNKDVFTQLLSIALLTPWAYVGFEAVSHGSEEFAFPRKRYYRMILRNDKRMEYGKSIVVWGMLLSLVLFGSTAWMQKSDQRTIDRAITDISTHIIFRDESQRQYVQQTLMEANRNNVRSSLMVTGMFALALVAIVSDYRYLRRRQEESVLELGEVRKVAYTDPLTGVKSSNAFREWERGVNDKIALEGSSEFAVAVCDLNGLKTVNDTLGHKAGDAYIKEAAHMICVTFKHSPVFRIGGDEFAVILEGEDYANRSEIQESFNLAARSNAETNNPVVALGMAEFDPAVDYTFKTVFDRADACMYQRKRELKQKTPED